MKLFYEIVHFGKIIMMPCISLSFIKVSVLFVFSSREKCLRRLTVFLFILSLRLCFMSRHCKGSVHVWSLFRHVHKDEKRIISYNKVCKSTEILHFSFKGYNYVVSCFVTLKNDVIFSVIFKVTNILFEHHLLIYAWYQNHLLISQHCQRIKLIEIIIQERNTKI